MEKLTYTHNADAAAVIAQTYDILPLAYVRSYGCQQNVNDGEKIRGVLMDIGFGVCDSVEQADLILFNTCAVREHAEQRVFGNVGALKKLKEKNPRLIIGVCGCMAQQKHIVDKLRASYPSTALRSQLYCAGLLRPGNLAMQLWAIPTLSLCFPRSRMYHPCFR